MAEKKKETPPEVPETNADEEKIRELTEQLAERDSKMTELEGKLAEQSLNLSVKETMTLFKGVENKTEIEENVTTIAKCGGKESLDAMTVILKRVMESMVVVDKSLTPSGGEGMSTEDKQSLEDLGGTVPEMVARIMEEHNRTEGN